jgi:hypothetical protein
VVRASGHLSLMARTLSDWSHNFAALRPVVIQLILHAQVVGVVRHHSLHCTFHFRPPYVRRDCLSQMFLVLFFCVSGGKTILKGTPGDQNQVACARGLRNWACDRQGLIVQHPESLASHCAMTCTRLMLKLDGLAASPSLHSLPSSCYSPLL